MKMQKKLNIVLIILTVILVSLISFGGIYYRNKNVMANRIPEYLIGTDLKGHRQIVLNPVSEEDTTSDSEQENNEEENENETEENVVAQDKEEKQENKETNPEEDKKNYKKSAEVFTKRLKSLKIDNYSIAVDEETGKIEINLPEDRQTDVVLSDLSQQGKFAIKDSKTDEDLLTNADVRNVKISRTQTADGNKTIYMSIYLNTKGTSKFTNITKNYQNNVDENEVETSENSTNETEAETETNETDELGTKVSEENETEEETESSTAEGKQVKMNIDDVTMLTTSFQEVIDNGVISLTLGASEDETSDELYSAYNLAAIIENEALPIKYEISGNTFISSAFESDQIKVIIYIEIGIALAIMLVLIAKYRIKGLLYSIVSIGYVAILLLAVRCANVNISVLGILAFEVCYIMNIIYSFIKLNLISDEKLTKKEKDKAMKEAIKKYCLILVPEIIIAIICCFTQWLQLLSLGMILFWGILISLVYNTIIDKLIES